jgi:hypothetical protein
MHHSRRLHMAKGFALVLVIVPGRRPSRSENVSIKCQNQCSYNCGSGQQNSLKQVPMSKLSSTHEFHTVFRRSPGQLHRPKLLVKSSDSYSNRNRRHPQSKLAVFLPSSSERSNLFDYCVRRYSNHIKE